MAEGFEDLMKQIEQNQSESIISSLSSTSTAESANFYDEDDDGPAVDPANCMLNGLRDSMKIIYNGTRQTLANCQNEEAVNDAANALESSSVKLLRSEISFLQSFKICTDIVDEVSTEEEDPHVAEASGDHNWDKRQNLLPHLPSHELLLLAKEKMSKMRTERVKAFETTLTDDKLKKHPRIISLRKQIEMGKEEFQMNYQKKLGLEKKIEEAGGNDEMKAAILLNSASQCVNEKEELGDNIECGLSTVDLIKKPVLIPENSVCTYIKTTSQASTSRTSRNEKFVKTDNFL